MSIPQSIVQYLSARTPNRLRPIAKHIYWRMRSTGIGARMLFPPVSPPAPHERDDDHVALLEAAADRNAIGIGKAPAGNEIVMLVVSDLRVDPRVEREAVALADAGFRVVVYCPDPTGREPAPALQWGRNIEINFLHWSAASFTMRAPGLYGGQLFRAAAKHRPFAFHAHDLNTALAAYAAARITGAHLVVDFHEWFSENVQWDGNGQRYVPHGREWKLPMQELERRCLKEASAVVTVCDTIADAMARELGGGRRPSVIRNIPNFELNPTKQYPPLKAQLGLPENQFLLLYQGGVGPSRFLEPVIEALGISKRCALVIRGPSIEYFEAHYRGIAARVGAADRLFLEPPVASRDVIAAARSVDAGLYTVLGVGRNFMYALPNKIFEYMAAGLPVLSASYPEARRIVEANDIGLVFEPDSATSIAAAIDRLIDNPPLRARFAANTSSALAGINAEGEWQKLIAIYNGLKQRTPAA